MRVSRGCTPSTASLTVVRGLLQRVELCLLALWTTCSRLLLMHLTHPTHLGGGGNCWGGQSQGNSKGPLYPSILHYGPLKDLGF